MYQEISVIDDEANLIDKLNEIFKNISKAKTYHEHEFYYNEYQKLYVGKNTNNIYNYC